MPCGIFGRIPDPMQSIYVLPLGFVFAYLAYKYDSVIPAIIAHILNNCAAKS